MKNEDEIPALIEKARESIGAARELLKSGYTDFAASRAYYAMFYAAEAILLSKELAFSKHSAVISAFGKEFIKAKVLPVRFQRYIMDAFDIRQAGDYGGVGDVSAKEAKKVIERAEEFVEGIEAYLKKSA